MKRLFTFCLFLVIAVFAFTLSWQNPGSITLKYYFGIEREVGLFLVIMIPFIIGVVLGALLLSFSLVRSKLQFSSAKRSLAKIEKEVEGLRAASVTKELSSES